MRRFTLLIFLIHFFLLSVHAQKKQIPVRTDPEGGLYNLAVISKLFIDVYGEKNVDDWLHSKRRIGILWDVDSLGYIRNFTLINKDNPILSKAQEQSLQKYIHTHIICLCFWTFDPCLGEDELSRLKEFKRMEVHRKTKDGGVIKLYVPFNDELVLNYDEVRKKGLKKGKIISYTQYLRYQIHKYRK